MRILLFISSFHALLSVAWVTLNIPLFKMFTACCYVFVIILSWLFIGYISILEVVQINVQRIVLMVLYSKKTKNRKRVANFYGFLMSGSTIFSIKSGE